LKDTGTTESLAARTPERGLSHLDWLALACFVFWSAGAALTHVIGIWAGIGGAAIGLGIATLLVGRSAIAPLLRPSVPLVAWGMAATLVMVAATYGLYPLIRGGSADFTRAVGALYVIFRTAAPLWITRLLLPFIILSEEFVWRGVVLQALCRRVSPAAAVLLGAIAYAAAHAPVGSPLLTALTLACGLFWSALRLRTNSLIPVLLCHFVWDILVFALRPLA
jgi:membrane protease YdiL (CAAX protease family)